MLIYTECYTIVLQKPSKYALLSPNHDYHYKRPRIQIHHRAHLLCVAIWNLSSVSPYVKGVELQDAAAIVLTSTRYGCYSEKNDVSWENSTSSLPQLASLYFSSHITILLTFKCRSQGDTDCEHARTLQSHGSRQKIMTAATQSKEKVLCC